MPNKFSPEQVAHLRQEFEKIERLDPCSETWLMLRETVQQMPLEGRCQLASAGIRWLSSECERQQKSLHQLKPHTVDALKALACQPDPEDYEDYA
jgi:hypothetical protein